MKKKYIVRLSAKERTECEQVIKKLSGIHVGRPARFSASPEASCQKTPEKIRRLFDSKATALATLHKFFTVRAATPARARRPRPAAKKPRCLCRPGTGRHCHR